MRRVWAAQGHLIIIGAVWGVGIGFAAWLLVTALAAG